jgi:hypothetical protein
LERTLTPLSGFAKEHKSVPGYLDVAANSHGAEKGLLTHRALRRIRSKRPHVVEIGPGGGAAVGFLYSQLQQQQYDFAEIDLTLIEVPGVTSDSLTQAIDEFSRLGTCTLIHGFAQDISALLGDRADVISASALFHEVYSYGDGYGGLHSLMRTLPSVIEPNGYFAYRDLYAVRGGSLHQRATHAYDSATWLQFIRMFVPHYLRQGTHPYHHAHDEIVARQDSHIVSVGELDPRTCAIMSAPIGLFREIQRHYVTFRDHVWRSGALGFTPVLEGQLAGDWLDNRTGHKRIHYSLTGTDWLPRSQKAMLLAVSEPYADHYTVDGDIFDECTDIALTAFLTAAERGDATCAEIWGGWSAREGCETYAYLTLDDLITLFAVNSAGSAREHGTVLLPADPGDIVIRQRHYYNRYLTTRLANPLEDAKQLVLFRNIPVSDSEALGAAMSSIQESCGKRNLARIYSAINTGE